MGNIQFDFGKNWDDFSNKALDAEKVEQAKVDFNKLIEVIEISNKSFLDIGFGQGLNLLIAGTLNAQIVGCDINPKCKEVLQKIRSYFPEIKNVEIPVIIGSILDENVIEDIKSKSPNGKTKKYDIVHSWGVLHHTGDMWNAITKACDFVDENGKLVISIYNRHWSSLPWKFIKWFYNISPSFIRRIMIGFFYWIIVLAKFLVTFQNPFASRRGMNFYFDVVDWVGGYPYEYASKDEIQNFIESRGFRLVRFNKAGVPTGCNEYVFTRIK